MLAEGTLRARRAVSAPGPDEPEEEVDRRSVGLDDLEPPRRFTRWHLGVVAAVLLVGLVWGGWSWLRTRPEAVAAPSVVQTAGAVPATPSAAPPSSAPPSSAPPSSAPPSSAPPSSALPTVTSAVATPSSAAPGAETPAAGLLVHVLGAVKHPGVVRLVAGARVQDAIRAAGGLRGDADPDELNLAEPLADGVQVVIGTRSHPAGEVRSPGGVSSGAGSSGGGTTGGSSTGSGGAVVDLNQASVDQLDTLPGVGPVTAQKILDWREQHGRFSRPDELQEIDGIGPKTYARIAPHVRV